MSRTMQRLAVGLESAVYGVMSFVAERAGGDEADDHDPLASPLTLPECEEPVLSATWPRAS